MIPFQMSGPVNSGCDEKPTPAFQCQEGEKLVNDIKL